jgi:hypothetical protein
MSGKAIHNLNSFPLYYKSKGFEGFGIIKTLLVVGTLTTIQAL